MIAWLSAVWRRWRRIWTPVVHVGETPVPPGADEDRAQVEDEKQEFADKLHDARRRVHFLEVAAAVRARRKDHHDASD